MSAAPSLNCNDECSQLLLKLLENHKTDKDLLPSYPTNSLCFRGFKTRLCVFHFAGKCRNGDNCTYAHNACELSDPKTFLCGCGNPFGVCFFAHSYDEVRIIPQKKTAFCRFYTLGKCRAGTACRHAHSIEELTMEDIIDRGAQERVHDEHVKLQQFTSKIDLMLRLLLKEGTERQTSSGSSVPATSPLLADKLSPA